MDTILLGVPRTIDANDTGYMPRSTDAERAAGMRLTESFAMLPTAAVSGWYFSIPARITSGWARSIAIKSKATRSARG